MIFWMIPFSLILLHGINDFGPVSCWLNSHGCGFWAKLGKLSIYVYLLHLQVILICNHMFVLDNCLVGSMLLLAVTLVSCALVMTIRNRWKARKV